MAAFPGSPRILKGALVGMAPSGRPSSVIVFQYNPETLTRRLVASAAGAGGGDTGSPVEPLRLKGPPQETIDLTVEIDAADQLEQGDPVTAVLGLYPTLAALEMLLYPKSSQAIANASLASVGIVEIVPPDAPLTVLVWGPRRIVPVRLTEFSVTEEQFDTTLNPILAKLALKMRVLTYQDLGMSSQGGALFLAHQIATEALAAASSPTNMAGATVGAISGV